MFIMSVLLAACGQSTQEATEPTAARCLEEAETALANDSVRMGETLLRKAIQLSEAEGDWHTHYIAHQRLADALSQSNPEEALRPRLRHSPSAPDEGPDVPDAHQSCQRCVG